MKQYFTSPKTFRYFTDGDPSKAKTLLYVMHGYGQLAEYFIRKFKSLGEEFFIVAPEGIHRFYLEGSSGRVGASWMTKEERECDINDNLNFLNALHEALYSLGAFDRVVILGFSQGGATAARWHYSGKVNADHLLIWASVFPPDLAIETEIHAEKRGTNWFFIGKEDEFYNGPQQQDQLNLYTAKGFESIHYAGKHDIDTVVLADVLKKIQRLGT